MREIAKLITIVIISFILAMATSFGFSAGVTIWCGVASVVVGIVALCNIIELSTKE